MVNSYMELLLNILGIEKVGIIKVWFNSRSEFREFKDRDVIGILLKESDNLIQHLLRAKFLSYSLQNKTIILEIKT